MKFSIITVCLNAGKDLTDTINSVLCQTYDDYELIIKDGMSTDGSVDNIPDNLHIKVVSCKDTGIYDAMNQGISASKGDYLIFMNAGDLFYDNNVLKCISEKIEQTPGDFYYGRCYSKTLNVVDPAPKKLTKFFCYRSMICHQTTIYRSEFLKKRGYDVSYTISADRERMLYAVIVEKLKCVYIPVVIVSFQGGGFCTTPKAKKMIEDEKNRLEKKYFSKKERNLYRIRYKMTFPGLRKKITQNKTLLKYYRKFISLFYGNR